jgi:hypothetical protein
MTEKEPTSNEQKLAEAYKKDPKKTRADNPNKTFRLKVVGGETVVVVKTKGK